MKKNIYIFTRCVWTFINFRYDLVNQINKKKFKVFVCMDFDGYKKKDLEKKYKNISFIDIKFLNQKKSMILDLKILVNLFLIFLNKKIDIVHNFTARPIVFVSLISFLFWKIKVINTITGLGNNFFQRKNLFKLIYNLIFLRSHKVIFQNNQDKKIIFSFISSYINTSVIYPTVKFKKKLKFKKTGKKVIFLMHSRMIRQKGVIEYVKAATYLKYKFKKKCFFYLIGDPDKNNPSSISQRYLNSLKLLKYRSVNYLPHTKNIFKYIKKSDVIVLPSYGEGLPASLLEALFLKKAVIATKVNGCLEIVKNNYNGFLVRPKNSQDLKDVFLKIINKPNLVNRFKKNSYRLYNKKFKKNSIKSYLKIYNHE